MKTITILGVVSMLALGLVSTSFASIDKNLKYGQRDKEVTKLQEFLISKGLLKTTPSDFFGNQTLKAIKLYQVSLGVSPTGFVGPQTREKINKDLGSVAISATSKAENVTNGDGVVVTNKIDVAPVVVPVNEAPANSFYDSNTKIDKLGREVTITQIPNYKSGTYVRASINISSSTVNGFFDKTTKTFTTEAELDFIAKQNQAEEDRRNGINKPVTSTSLSASNSPVLYVTTTEASFRRTYLTPGVGGIFTYSFRNLSDKVIEVKSINYRLEVWGGFSKQSIPVSFAKTGTSNSEVAEYITNTTGYQTYKFIRPIVIFPKDTTNINIEYPIETKNGLHTFGTT